jgi:hypothetical protein
MPVVGAATALETKVRPRKKPQLIGCPFIGRDEVFVIEYMLLAENGAMVSAAVAVNMLLREIFVVGKVDICYTSIIHTPLGSSISLYMYSFFSKIKNQNQKSKSNECIVKLPNKGITTYDNRINGYCDSDSDW